MSRYARRSGLDIWPGFVDGLAAILMVVVFLVLLFALGQWVLSDSLQNKTQALDSLSLELQDTLANLDAEQDQKAALEQLINRLRVALGDTERILQDTQSELAITGTELDSANQTVQSQNQTITELQAEIARLAALRAELEAAVGGLEQRIGAQDQALADAAVASEQQQANNQRLAQRVDSLTAELRTLQSLLGDKDATIADQQATIADLDDQLNQALKERVEELSAYRSEFFGRLKEILGQRDDIRIEGDRFVLQAELLFDSGSAELAEKGRTQVARLSGTLKALIERIPADIDWVLRIDGHTDKRPINTPEFPSNWELSTARAVAIVKAMIELGIPAKNLAATGFGAHHPINPGSTDAALAENRRIEFKLTSR